MDLSSTINSVSEKITLLEQIKNDMISSIESHDEVASDTLLGLANDIYNIGSSEKTIFVIDDTENYMSFTGYAGIRKRAEYINKCKIYINNALISRNIDTSNSKFSEFPDLILNITDDEKLSILNIKSEDGAIVNYTKITISTEKISEENSYKYEFINILPFLNSDVSNWKTWDGISNIKVDSNDNYICIAECNSENKVIVAGIAKIDYKERYLLPNELIINTEAGQSLFSTKVTEISDKLTDGNMIFYAIYDQSEQFYLDDTPPSRYILWDEKSEISLNESDKYNYLTFLEVSIMGMIKRIGIVDPTIRDYALPLTVTSAVGNTVGYTILGVNPKIIEGNSYYITYGHEVYISDEIIDESLFIPWDGISEIELDNESIITLLEVSSDMKVKKFGNTTVNSLDPDLKTLIVESIDGDEPYSSILSIIPEKHEQSKYYYKESDSVQIYEYGDTIDLSSYNYWDNESMIYIKNGTRILMIEVIGNKLIGMGYTTINSNIPYIKNLKLESVYGTDVGTTHINIETEKDNENNFYVYLLGNKIIKYDDDVSNWISYDFSKDLINLSNGDILSIVECDTNYHAKKLGIVSINIKPIELIILNITSAESNISGCTKLYIKPEISSGNKYKYSFTNILPNLYDDVSDWNDYNIGDNIEAVTGDNICIVECNINNQVLKAGTTTVVASEPEPVLEIIYIDSVAGYTSGYTKLSVMQPLTDGYHYVYKETDTLPEYNDDLSTWILWDGLSEIQAKNGILICIAEVTDDNFVHKAGLVEVYS